VQFGTPRRPQCLAGFRRPMAKPHTLTWRGACSSPAPRHEWTETAFRDFIALDGNREAMLASIAAHAGHLASRFEAWRAGVGSGAALAQAMLDACAQIDNGNVWHTKLRLRSYVDVSIQAMALRLFVEYLAARRGARPPVTPGALTALLLEHHPNARAALLVDAALLLEAGDADAAIEA